MRISHNDLLDRINYDPETGEFRWKVKPAKQIRVGTIAGCRMPVGYIYIKIGGVCYYAHRLAWFYMNGRWPVDEIDHKNRVKDDNRFENLREANRSLNEQNRIVAKRPNKSGFLGVCRHRNGWKAQITIRRQMHYLGTFQTAELAHEMYLKAKKQLHQGYIP